MLAFIVAAIAVPATAMATQGAKQESALEADLHCLAQNIYFEARGEPLEGKLAVAHVVLNRMADDRFPRQACSVIRQGGERRRHRCQFSWWCDGRSDRPRDQSAWEESKVIAVLIKAGLIPDPTGGSLWYHANYVQPDWAERLTRKVKIGKHIFYTDKPTQVANAD
jgi:spore germination cell wall hydrolase CwlJ-like protein